MAKSVRYQDRDQGYDEDRDMRHSCGICMEPYWGRSPKILPCHHTYCLPCLTELSHSLTVTADIRRGDDVTGATFPCPTCRATVVVPAGGVAALQTNFYVDHEPDDFRNTHHHDVRPATTQKDTDDVTADLRTSLEKTGFQSGRQTKGAATGAVVGVPGTSPSLPSSFTNVFIKNFADHLNDRTLKELFSPYGVIRSASVAVDNYGKSRGFGFISFSEPQAARRAVEAVNGSLVGGRTVYCGPFQARGERRRSLIAEKLKGRHEDATTTTTTTTTSNNLYLKNLADTIDDDQLRQLFAEFGTITSAKVMTDWGRSKGFGFVCFSSPQEARRAKEKMHGRVVEGRALYVAQAQRKEDRRAQLASRHNFSFDFKQRTEPLWRSGNVADCGLGGRGLDPHQSCGFFRIPTDTSRARTSGTASDPRAVPQGNGAFKARSHPSAD